MPPKKIVLAEDDADDRAFFYDSLQNRADITLLSAVENGEEVIDLLSEIDQSGNLPDLILLDQNMPKKNGLQTLLQLKDEGIFKNIPVFIYSTYTDDVLQKQSMDAGAASVFSKPYTPEGYHQMMDAMLALID